jgi:hypothetical protein
MMEVLTLLVDLQKENATDVGVGVTPAGNS